MGVFKVERRGAVAHVTMDDGKANAMNDAFLTELDATLAGLEKDKPGAVVLAGRTGMFSAGLDLVGLPRKSRAEMTAFLDRFKRVFARFYTFPRPVVAAVSGHAIAGGCILALCADVRIGAKGRFKLGVNEVRLNIPFPRGTTEVITDAVPARYVPEVLLEGRLFSPDEAVERGLLHEAVDPERLLPHALDRAETLAHAPDACAVIKDALRHETVAKFVAKGGDEAFLDAWFKPETQATLQAAVAAFAKR